MKLKDEIEAMEKAAVAVRKTREQIVKEAAVDADLDKMQWIIDANERETQKIKSGETRG